MVKRTPARRRPRKAKPGTKGLGPGECRLDQPTLDLAGAGGLPTKKLGRNRLAFWRNEIQPHCAFGIDVCCRSMWKFLASTRTLEKIWAGSYP
jgi:hypothetical protein